MNRKVLLFFVLFVLIIFLGYFVLSLLLSPPDSEFIQNQAAQDQQTQTTVSDNTQTVELKLVLSKLMLAASVDFTDAGGVRFYWQVMKNDTKELAQISGYGIYVNDVNDAVLSEVEAHFISEGFIKDDLNVVENTDGGIQGFVKGSMVCTSSYGWLNSEGGSVNSQVSCGYLE